MASERAERYVAIGKTLGHTAWRVEQTPRGFRGYCACGYSCTNRRTEELVAQALYHHLRKAVDEQAKNGVSVPVEQPIALQVVDTWERSPEPVSLVLATVYQGPVQVDPVEPVQRGFQSLPNVVEVGTRRRSTRPPVSQVPG